MSGTVIVTFQSVSYTLPVFTTDFKRIIISVAFGIVSTVLPYLCYTLGLKNVENGKASIIASIEPVTATVLGIIIFSEPVTVTGILGVVMVVSALVICNLKSE